MSFSPFIPYSPLLSENVHFVNNISGFVQQRQEKNHFTPMIEDFWRRNPFLFICFALFSLQLPNEGLWQMDWLMVASKYWNWKPPPTYPHSISSHPSPHQSLTAFAAVGSPEAVSALSHIPGSHSFSRHIILALELMKSSNSQRLSPEVPGSETVSFHWLTWLKTSLLSVWRWPCGWVQCLWLCEQAHGVCIWKGGNWCIIQQR